MRKLNERGHKIYLQENIAMKEASPAEFSYFLARSKCTLLLHLKVSDGYDLIFASKPETALLAYLLSRKFSKPFVLDLDDLERISALDIRGYGTSFLVKKAAKIFTASRELYRLCGKKRNDVVYLPNTTNLEHFNPEKYRNVKKPDAPTFLWISDKTDWFTGCNVIFTSLAKLKRGRVIIIGSGPRAYFRELSKKLRIERQVIIKDWIPDKELPKLYMTCDVGLLPFSDNLWTRCKCPSRLFEFMAMELPYICTVGEPAYMARKLNCGLTAKPEVDDFTEQMKYAVDHLEELKGHAKQGRKYLLEKQNFNILAEKLDEELCATLSAR